MVEQAWAAQVISGKCAEANVRAGSRRANYLAASVTLIAMGCALFCVLYGRPWVAGAFLSLPVMSVARALVL